ncbi:MAG: glycosyltransferase [Trebonia sp.]
MTARDRPWPPADRLPTVTAMMVVYNCPGFIARAIDSVLAQDYPPDLLDIVIVDDGCTDSTPEAIERYRSLHPDRITVVHQDNAGLVGATNTAVAHAHGELLAMIDADDLWPVDKTRRQVQRLLGDPSLGLVYCDTEVIDPYDEIRRFSYWEWLKIKPQRGPTAFPAIMGQAGNIALASTIMFRAALAERIFPIPLRVPFQDWWITAHAAALTSIDCIEGLRTGYRQHGANATLGATGLWEVRETCKTAEMRRQMLIHGGGDHLTDRQLFVAWQAWENSARVAVLQAHSAYVPLRPSSDEEREQGCRFASQAEEATLAGDLSLALRLRIRALACNPLDSGSRQWVHDLGWLAGPIPSEADNSGESGPIVSRAPQEPLEEDPLAGCRSFITLAYLDELVGEPQLLDAYASVVTEADDATLVVSAVGLDDRRALDAFVAAAARIGLELGHLPDVLLVTTGGPAAKVELERRADAVLTRRMPKLTAPAFRPEHITELHALAIA